MMKCILDNSVLTGGINKMKVKKVLKVMSVAAVVGMLGVTLAGCGIDKDLHAETVAQLEQAAVMNEQLEEANAAVQATQANLSAELEAFKLEVSVKDALIEEFNAEIIAEEKEAEAYLIDELAIGTKFNETLSDKELNLVDSELEFDGDDYDYEEVLSLTDFEVLTNQEEEAEKVFISIPEEGISYSVVFESSLNTSEIDEDDTLNFNLLGKEVEVIEWNGDEIVFSQGFKTSMEEGATLDYNGNAVSISAIGDDYVYVKVGEEGKKIKEGDTKLVGAIEVKINDVLYQGYAGGVKLAEIELGKEVNVDVKDGDEYAKDSVWEWTVSSNSVGLKLIEAFDEYGTDEEYLALGVDKSLSLPNDFATFTFAGLSEEKVSKFTFESDTKKGSEYVKAKGAFTFGLEDYDRVYLNATGIFDEDLDLIHATKITMDDTEFDLEISGNDLIVDDIKFAMNFSFMDLDGSDVSSVEEDMRSVFGVVIDGPEDSLEDEKVSLEVPEEKLEATVKVTQ
jgi:hypothetical protein